MAINFHNSYDSNLDGVVKVAEDMGERMNVPSEDNRNLRLENARLKDEMEQTRKGVSDLTVTITELNQKVDGQKANNEEHSAKYRRLNDNINVMINKCCSLKGNS